MKLKIAALALLLSTSGVMAADLAPQPVEPAVPAEMPYSWAGFYVGVYAGASFNHDKAHPINSRSAPVSLNSTSFTGGGLAGYNFQINSFVLGAEGEFGFDGTKKSGQFYSVVQQLWDSTEVKESYIGRARIRLGYAVMPQLLVYAAGGASFADDKVTLSNSRFTYDISKSRAGWNLGAGVEYAFTDHLIGRVEYIYDDFGKRTYNFLQKSGGYYSSRKVDFSKNTVRAALEYKF